MFFPYFRGRQYELLALKELAQKGLISKYVIPVVEPIKISPTLKNTIQAFEKADLNLAMILNPAVGDFADSDASSLVEIKKDSKNIIPAVIFNESAEETFNNLEELEIEKNTVLSVLNNPDYVDYFKEIYSDDDPAYVLLPDERRMRRAVKENKVLFEDKFNKQSKNSDYLKCEDEPFRRIICFSGTKDIRALEIIRSLEITMKKVVSLHGLLPFILYIYQMTMN